MADGKPPARGIVQYYLLAGYVFRIHRLRWVIETYMLKTLISKHRSTVTQDGGPPPGQSPTPYGLRTRLEASIERPGKKPLVAWFRGIPLKRQKTAVPTDRQHTGPIYPTGSWSPGCSREDASSASERTTPLFTTSARWPTSTGPASRSPNGPRPWLRSAASPLWSAATATT